MGYDIFNEPWPSTVDETINMSDRIAQFDQDILLPLYSQISEAIKDHDEDKILFFQAGVFPNVVPSSRTKSPGDVNGVGFDATPSGAQLLDKQVLSEHMYCCQGMPEQCKSDRYTAQFEDGDFKTCEKFLDEKFK